MWCLFGPPDWSVCHPVASSTCPQVQALLALCHLHVLLVWPSRLVSLSSSSPLLLAYRCRPYLLCATCMWCLFGPPDWSVCHPVASSTCPQVQALLALCHLHVLLVWPSRLVSLSSSSPLLLAYRCRPYLLCATCMCCLFGPPDWSVCHPVASPTCPQVQALLALCHLHVVPVWPSRLVSLSSSSLFYLPTGAGPTCSACLTGQLSSGCSQHSVQHSCSIQLGHMHCVARLLCALLITYACLV